jgi:hypothetical protein
MLVQGMVFVFCGQLYDITTGSSLRAYIALFLFKGITTIFLGQMDKFILSYHHHTSPRAVCSTSETVTWHEPATRCILNKQYQNVPNVQVPPGLG